MKYHEYLEHRAQPGERWDHIALKYYGDPKLTSPIMRANADVLDTPLPLIFETETLLRVPVLEEAEITQPQLPPWKR